MSPEVAVRKLALLNRFLADLKKHAAAGADRYAIERLCQLVVEVLSDITTHWLVARHGYTAGGYRQAFRRAVELGVYPPEIAPALDRAAGLRNLLVQLYDEIDPDRLLDALPALIDAAERAAGSLAAECAIDMAHHLIADRGWKTPATYKETFAVLRQEGVLSAELAGQMENWAALRNVLVHLYQEVDHGIVYDVLNNHLDQLSSYSTALEKALATQPIPSLL